MRRRRVLASFSSLAMIRLAQADSSHRGLASYYQRHMALRDGVAFGWVGQGAPARLRDGVRQVGVGRDRYFALLDDGRLLRWSEDPAHADTLMQGVAWFAAGQSGWFAADAVQTLWFGGSAAAGPVRVAEAVAAACVGDSADYFVRADGRLYAKGLAHRGQYGDGLLRRTTDFVVTADDALSVKAHTGHALYLQRDGTVMGTGGNRFGPLSRHGLGDKADRWGAIFDGAVAIATGSRHSLALRKDDGLWVWGEGYGIEPRKLFDGVTAAAAGDTATLALRGDGSLWQWEGGGAPRRLNWP
jgi:alpha-tubulin suppressor-like RCC1 family protein